MNALVNSDLHCLGKDRSQETFQTVSKEEVSEYTLRVLNNTVDGFSKQSLYGDRQMSSGPLLTVQISEDQSAGFRIILNAITSADHKRLSSLEIFTQTRRKDKKSGTAVEVYSTVDTAICKFQ
jgi:hypothetical protein